jgi:hypothetical protein
MLENLTAEDFRPCLNQQFTIRLEDGSDYSLELFQVNETGTARTPGERRPFALLFRNPRTDGYLAQRIYRLEHPALGTLEVFIVPLGAFADGMHYEVIFG